jgi:hypothetical protein
MRRSALLSLEDMLGSFKKEDHVLLLQEPGVLPALSAFLVQTITAPNVRLTLSILDELVRESSSDRQPAATAQCAKILFDSQCFLSVLDWACINNNVFTDDFDYAAMGFRILFWIGIKCSDELFLHARVPTVLLHGLKSKNKDVVDLSMATLDSCMFEFGGGTDELLTSHPDLVRAVVDTMAAAGMNTRFGDACNILFNTIHTQEKTDALLKEFPYLPATIEEQLEQEIPGATPNATSKSAQKLLSRFKTEQPVQQAPLTEQEKEIGSLKDKNHSLAKANEEIKRKIDELNKNCNSAEENMAELTTQLSTSVQELSAAKKALSSNEATIREKNSKNILLARQVEALTEEVAAGKKSALSRQESVDEMRGNCGMQRMEISQLTKTAETQSSEISALKKHIATTAGKIVALGKEAGFAKEGRPQAPFAADAAPGSKRARQSDN